MERKGIITMRGKAMTLVGPDLTVGTKAPGFSLIDKDLHEVKLSDYAGKIKVISVTPSLDTPVCDLQARRFNHEASLLPADVVVLNISMALHHEASLLPADVVVLNISMDLPFAISRFCTIAGIEKVVALSDHRDGSFGEAYGVLIKELRLLARSIFILDKDDIVRYREIVPEQGNHVDYESALKALVNVTDAAKAA
jgi:thioredoxin-dependent peroxiredoxin